MKRVDKVWVGSDGDIFVWDINKPEKFHIVKGHTDLVNDIRNVGPYEVWSCSSDWTIRCWNTENLQCLQVIKCKAKLVKIFFQISQRTLKKTPLFLFSRPAF